jgi:SAM-dependent methyltransferase
MPDVIHRRNTCRACEGLDLELVFSLKPSPIGDAYVTSDKVNVPQLSYPIELHMCKDCGLAQLIDVIDQGILYGEYIYVTASSVGLAEHFQDYAHSVIDRCRLKQGSLVVDIGSNDGTLLRQFQQRGMSVLGVEPATHIAAQATASGIKSIDKFFTPDLARKMVEENGHAKLITANNVFANIDDLLLWVNAINELLDDNGVFVFESYYLADLVQNMVFDFIYHEHLSAFSVKPMQILFQRIGLELVAVERVPTKGGSLRYFVQRPGGPLIKDGTVNEMLLLEENMGLYCKDIFVAFADKINGLKVQTKNFLALAKSEGKSIAGFGASITGTTLIYHFEIGEHLDYLIDDNSAKQKRFSPGLHLQVLPSSALYERKPDYVVILAWRFSKIIISKNQAYLKGGGHFLIPIPEFKIVTEAK